MVWLGGEVTWFVSARGSHYIRREHTCSVNWQYIPISPFTLHGHLIGRLESTWRVLCTFRDGTEQIVKTHVSGHGLRVCTSVEQNHDDIFVPVSDGCNKRSDSFLRGGRERRREGGKKGGREGGKKGGRGREGGREGGRRATNTDIMCISTHTKLQIP